MCIRDRCLPVHRGRSREDHPNRGQHRPRAADDGRGARLQPCLLYTSDAADERSSVDLGGRRIIKKKSQK